MNSPLASLRSFARKLLRTGFFSIFFSNVLCKVLTFIGGMAIVRIFSKSDYGAYIYVTNCYGMLMLLGDLGCSVASMQFCNENYDNPEKFSAYFTYGFKRGILFSVLTSFLLLLSPLFYPFKTQQAAKLTQLLFFMPILGTVNSFLLANLRIHLKNALFAAINIYQAIVHYLVILPMSYWIGVTGAIISNYIISILVLLFGIAVSRKLLEYPWREDNLNRREKKSFLKLAFGSQLNNGTANILMLLDVFLIGVIIGDDEIISSYKVATTIPTALNFIPTAVMVYVTPYFARYNQDKQWIRRNYFKLILGSAIGNLTITSGCILIAQWIIPMIFGRQYIDAVPCFLVLMVGYFFGATFQIPSQNIIYTQRKVRVNIVITFICGVANCVLDVMMILGFGSIGAAWATTLVYIINSALGFSYMCFYFRRKEQ